MPKKTKAQAHADDVNERSAKAGYEVKDHGHRFFNRKLTIDRTTGEMFMPDGFKFVAFLSEADTLITSGQCLRMSTLANEQAGRIAMAKRYQSGLSAMPTRSLTRS